MTTPMFTQYHELKAKHPNSILFFRMGDFYEMFYEDARLAAKVLDITLTARNKNSHNPIPMAGIPHHAASSYVKKLVAQGYRVAIAEQVEDPNTTKGLVKREVMRVVTPGVVVEPENLTGILPNFLAAVVRFKNVYGLAFLDVSTGEFRVTQVNGSEAAKAELSRHDPREILWGPGIESTLGMPESITAKVTKEAWDSNRAYNIICNLLDVANLNAFELRRSDPGTAAAGAAVRYAQDVLCSDLCGVHSILRYHPSGYMSLDPIARRNLELTETVLTRERNGSLLGLLDQCVTSMGSRLLRQWILFPLGDQYDIVARQSIVTTLVRQSESRQILRRNLRGVADLSRISSRLANGRASPRDLAALCNVLARRTKIEKPCVQAGLTVPGPWCSELLKDLQATLTDEPPLAMHEGGLIRSGVDPVLDELTGLSLNGVGAIEALGNAERKRTGIYNLKVKRNKVFGYFFEVSRAQLSNVPPRFIRKQTLSNCERYFTPELKELEERALGANEKRLILEQQLFNELRNRAKEWAEPLQALAHELASLDVLCTFAELAHSYQWSCPEISKKSHIHLLGSRHPVVESIIKDDFVKNDIHLTPENRVMIITGPNMAGKSTLMRQVAISILLAHVGSFIPADRASIGICDRIFTRVGAVDDLSGGQSTFMVEMSETATILHQATDRSLVLLDEVGRGTSTYDGLSIAWSVVNDLASRIKCRTLFATHYHELCALAEPGNGIFNCSVAVDVDEEQIVFLRKLKAGGANKSYGIQCAQLAGLPSSVVQEATVLLAKLEDG